MRRRPSQSILGSVIKPSHWLFYVTVVVSLGLHGVLLRSPVPEARSQPEPEEPETAEVDTIKILRLNGQDALKPVATDGASTTTPQTPKSPEPPQPKPQPTPTPTPPLPPKIQTPSPTPSPSPEAPAPQTPASPPPPTPEPAQPAQNEQTPVTPSSPAGDEGGDTSPIPDAFPDLSYPGSVSGSNNLFDDSTLDAEAENTTDSIAQVIDYYQQNASSQGEFALDVEYQNSDAQAYKVTASGHSPKYLHVVEHENARVIFVANALVTAVDLENQRRLVQMPPQQRLLENQLAQANTVGSLEWSEVVTKLPSSWQSEPQDSFALRGKISNHEVDALKQTLEQDFSASEIVPGANIYIITNNGGPDFSISLALVDLEDGTFGVISQESVV